MIVMGDFNINLNVPNKKWTDLVNQVGLLQLINQSTRVQAHSQSLIDHVYVSKPTNISDHGVNDIGLSDHHMIFATRKLGTKTLAPKPRNKITYLDWQNFSPASFQRDLCNIRWDDMYLAQSIEPMLDTFNRKLHEVISKNLRMKTRYVKSTIIPAWLDHEAQQNIKKRDSLKRTNAWEDYKRQRNYTTNLIKRKKKEYVANLIANSKGRQTKQLWQVLRNSQQRSNITPELLDPSDALHPPSDCDIANAINSHFVNIARNINISSPSSANYSPDQPTTHSLYDIPTITPAEVVLLFKDIGPNKATGLDQLSVKILRLAIPFITIPLTDLLNRGITECSFPSQWKQAIVTPIHKGGDRNDLSNYRPISVLPVLSKIYERHILKSLSGYIRTYDLISSSQSGFRANHSCTTAMQHMFSEWSDKLISKHTIVMLFLDFRKAFDMVGHNIILDKLKLMGIRGNFLSILKSYLQNRTQCVKVNSSQSQILPITCGVPQGSILAPTLFQIFINDLLTLPLNSHCHAYADDTTFYLGGNDPTALQKLVSKDLVHIEGWCTTNRMSLNYSKSHYLVVNPPPAHKLTFKLNSHTLCEKSTTQLLGFTINNSLNWSNHIDNISKKVAKNLRLFYNIRHLLDFNTSKLYYFNYINSYLIYGLHLYYPTTPANRTNALFLLQKRALRLICKDYNGSSQPNRTLATKFTSETTKILPLPTLSLYFTCIAAYRIMRRLSPSYLVNTFSRQQIRPTTRHRHKLPCSLLYNRLNHHLVHSFNCLPEKLRRLPPSSFKSKLKMHLMNTL
jgi:hypothetical protein